MLYGLLVVVAIWLIGPFVWLFVTSVSLPAEPHGTPAVA